MFKYFILIIFYLRLTLQDYSNDISNTKTSKLTDQIILVIKNKLYFYEKIDDNWNEIFSTDCNIGKNGMIPEEEHLEGQGKTPMGSFPILYAFGTKPMHDLNIHYRRITPFSYCVDDSTDMQLYNSWVESETKLKGEHLIEYQMAYELSFSIGFNVKDKVKDRGSCVFLHMFSENDYTQGCVAIAKDMMYKLIHIINNYAYIIIVEIENQIINY